MTHRWIEIDLKQFAANVKAIRRELKPSESFMAVVKFNAYGHGLSAICETLAAQSLCESVGVWSLEEACEVDKIFSGFGKTPNITLLAPAVADQEALAWGIRRGVVFDVDSRERANFLIQTARRTKCVVRVALDVDFGLARWGVLPKEVMELMLTTLKNSCIQMAGITTHVDYVPGLHKTEAQAKLAQFFKIAQQVEYGCARAFLKSCANTTVFLDFPKYRGDRVRLGNLIYGVNPTAADFPVKNIWTFKARILSIRRVRRGEAIGYGGEHLALGNMRVASIACGFADGLTVEPAHRFIRLGAPAKYWARFQGKNLPIVGRVGMGHSILDVTRVPGIRVGDVVDLPVRRTAASGSIPRIYIKEGELPSLKLS